MNTRIYLPRAAVSNFAESVTYIQTSYTYGNVFILLMLRIVSEQSLPKLTLPFRMSFTCGRTVNDPQHLKSAVKHLMGNR
ncbi:hypothetical protein TNCV_2083171 [Trichonephila clavipes]|nr:hypothetical protein TNCV_2083171 [Trichonephila clavipes]